MKINVDNGKFVEAVQLFEQEHENYQAALKRSWNFEENRKFLDEMFFKAGEAAISLAKQVIEGMPDKSKHTPDLQKLEHLSNAINMMIHIKNAGIEPDIETLGKLLTDYVQEAGLE